MSYGPNLPDLFRRAADFVDKILRGAKPGEIPVEQPTKFDLVINPERLRHRVGTGSALRRQGGCSEAAKPLLTARERYSRFPRA